MNPEKKDGYTYSVSGDIVFVSQTSNDIKDMVSIPYTYIGPNTKNGGHVVLNQNGDPVTYRYVARKPEKKRVFKAKEEVYSLWLKGAKFRCRSGVACCPVSMDVDCLDEFHFDGSKWHSFSNFSSFDEYFLPTSNDWLPLTNEVDA